MNKEVKPMVKSESNKVTMYNPKNNVIIVTNESFQSHWEKLGFVIVDNIVLFRMAV